jgi:hypothetical protein
VGQHKIGRKRGEERVEKIRANSLKKLKSI